MLDAAYWGVVMVMIYVGFNYLMPIFLPFILGYLFSVLSHQLTKNRSTLMLASIYVLLGILLVVLFSGLFGFIGGRVSDLPSFYRETIEPYINEIYRKLSELNDTYNLPFLSDALDTAFEVIKNNLSSIVGSLISVITSGVAKVPNILFSVMIFIISSFYFTADYDTVDRFVSSHGVFKKWFMEKFLTIFKCYAIIISLTFVELSIGLSILGISNAILLGFVIALVDILPVLGTGTVLIPWGIILLLLGSWKGIGILILYVIITVVRQYVEPKLVGTNLGIPAILSLMSMVLGLRMFGLVGMMGLPLLVSFWLYSKAEKEKAEKPETGKTEKPNAAVAAQ